MLATSDRVRPCRARCSPRSVGRETRSWPSSCLTVMSRCTRSLSAPRGPLTWTISGSMATVTEAGTGMGLRPMRLMRSPHVGDDLAADARLTGLVTGHHAVGRGDDGGAHAALDLGDLRRAHVGALAGARHAPQAADGALAAVGV